MHAALLDQEAPDAQVPAPEAVDAALQALGTPVTLLDVLEAGQLVHQPQRQALGMKSQVKRLPGGGQPQSALYAQEAAEQCQPVAAGFEPIRADALGLHVGQGTLQVGVQVEFGVRLEVEAQSMSGDGQVDGAGGDLGCAALQQPGLVALVQLKSGESVWLEHRFAYCFC